MQGRMNALLYEFYKKETKKTKKAEKKWKRKRSDLVCGNTPMLAYWVQIKMGKTF
jgi:hypothetical protein